MEGCPEWHHPLGPSRVQLSETLQTQFPGFSWRLHSMVWLIKLLAFVINLTCSLFLLPEGWRRGWRREPSPLISPGVPVPSPMLKLPRDHPPAISTCKNNKTHLLQRLQGLEDLCAKEEGQIHISCYGIHRPAPSSAWHPRWGSRATSHLQCPHQPSPGVVPPNIEKTDRDIAPYTWISLLGTCKLYRTKLQSTIIL